MPTIGRAHDIRPERDMVIQLDGQGGAILWRVQMTGWRADVMGAVHDVDRDRQLTHFEEQRLAAALLQKGMHGVTVWVDGASLADRSMGVPPLQITMDKSAMANGQLIALGLLDDLIPLYAPLQSSRHHLRVLVRKDTGPVALWVQRDVPWRMGDSAIVSGNGVRRSIDRHWRDRGMITLQPGDALELALAY